eukprot:1167861_1
MSALFVCLCLASSIIVSSGFDVFVSHNCTVHQEESLCASSISDALLLYSNHSNVLIKIDSGHDWVLNTSLVEFNMSLIGDSFENTSIVFGLFCSDCSLRFENVSLLFAAAAAVVNISGSSDLWMHNVKIDSSTNVSGVPVTWMFGNQSKWTCNRCSFFSFCGLRLAFSDETQFNAIESQFESLDGCTVNDIYCMNCHISMMKCNISKASISAYDSSLIVESSSLYLTGLLGNASHLQLIDTICDHSTLYLTDTRHTRITNSQFIDATVRVDAAAATNGDEEVQSSSIAHACGNHTFCYYLNASTLLHVAASHRQETRFDIHFNVVQCTNPTISLYYETITTMKVLNHNQSLIAQCDNSSSRNQFATCLDHYSLPHHEPFIISLHTWSINALLQLTCANANNATNTSCHSHSMAIQSNTIQIPFTSFNGRYLSNTSWITSSIYGYDVDCYDIHRMTMDLFAQPIIPTVPTLFIDTVCDYYDVLLKFQELGADAIVVVSSPHTTHTTQWLPFECLIDHDPGAVNYSTLLHWISNIFEAQINMTNIQQKDQISFIMEVTDKNKIDSAIDAIISNLIDAACNVNTNACPVPLTHVFCETAPVIAIMSDTHSYHNASTMEGILIPILLVNQSDAPQLTPYALSGTDFNLSFTCDEAIDLSNPNRTTSIRPPHMIAYTMPHDTPMPISFPKRSFASFYTTIHGVCGVTNHDIAVTTTDLELFGVSIQTVYHTLHGLCIGADENHQNILHTADGTQEIKNCGDASLNDFTDIAHVERGSYCFITWKSSQMSEFAYAIVSLFAWTTPVVEIEKSEFKNSAISIISQSNVDESISVSIRNSHFVCNNGSCIHRIFSFASLERLLSSSMSVLSIVNVSAIMGHGSTSFLSSHLATSFENGFVFKNAILMENVTIHGATDDARTDSAIYLEGSNAWIGRAVISNLNTNYGAIYLMNSALQLVDSIISQNTATGNGAALYQDQVTIYDHYDVCVSLIGNSFIGNEAMDYGGAIYVHLIGQDSDTMHPESCIQLIDNVFMNNTAATANDVYLNVTNGYHSVLDNNDTLNTICDINNGDCTGRFHSSVETFCIAVTLDSAEECESETDRFTNVMSLNVSTYPGASASIYVFGRDAFDNLVASKDYAIFVESDSIFIITPNGASIENRPHAYLINILMDVLSNSSTFDDGQMVSITDVNGIVKTATINFKIDDCANTEYKHWISDELDVYTCESCANGLYTLDSTQCKTCPEFLQCIHNEIIVKQSHHVNRELAEEEVKGMCGACNDGYDETTSSQGHCKKCKAWQGTVWLFVYIVFGSLVVLIIFRLSTSQRTVPSPLVTYLNRTLFFYYQILAFITFRSYIPLLHTITEMANLNFTISQVGACLYLRDVGPRQKVVMSLTIPAILIASFAFTFVIYWCRKRAGKYDQSKENWWHRRIIAFANTADVLVRTIYLQLTYICLRLCVCSRYNDGNWYMWYAGQVECFDGWHVMAWVFLIFFVLILPVIIYRVQLYYKYNHPESFGKLFANTILSYRQPCWYYGVVDLFRRAGIVAISISTYSSWMIVGTGSLLVLHCTLMPYRWRVNNFLEMFVLAIIFLEAVLNDTDLAAVSIVGIKVNFDPVLIVFAFLPLLPVPWLLYECFDWSKWANIHFTISKDLENRSPNELPEPLEENIVKKFKCCGQRTFVWYVGDKIRNENYGMVSNASLDPLAPAKIELQNMDQDDDEQNESSKNEDDDDDAKEQEDHKDKNAESENQSHDAQTTKSKQNMGVAISATPTRNGWKYPFKISSILKRCLNGLYCCYCTKGDCLCKKRSVSHDVGDQSVTVDLIITFSDDIPPNTFVDSTDIAQHLSYWTKKLGCTIFINRVSGRGTQFMVEFTARWQNFQNLDKDLLEIGYELAMEEEMFNALDHNNELTKDLIKSFKIPPSQQAKEIKVIDVEIQGSLSNEDRNKFLMQQLLHQHSLSNEETTKELDKIKYLPLHRWTVQHLKIKIKHWVTNDCQYKQRKETLMNIFSEKTLSGKRIVNLGNELKIVLKNAIGNEWLMTPDTFEIIYEHLHEEMQDTDGQDRLGRHSAPQMALMISRIPLDNIMQRIDAQEINGSKFIKFYKTDVEWISEATGWAQTEILQIETVLLKHHTYQRYKINEKLTKNLERNMGSRVREEFEKRIENESSEDYIDLEVLHLKLINGYPIDEEAETLLNVAGDLQKLQDSDVLKEPLEDLVEDKEMRDKPRIVITNSEHKADDADEDEKYNDDAFILNLMKSVAACFALSVKSEKQLKLEVSTRNIMRQKSPSDDTLAALSAHGKNQRMKVSKQTDWSCSNCGNYNHKFYVGGKMVENWKECTLCGVKELNSVVNALYGKYTYVIAARSIYDREEKKQEDANAEDNEDDAESQHDAEPSETKEQVEIMLGNSSTFHLRKIACPLRPSQKACKRVVRLAKQLKTYQQWIQKVHQEKGATPSVAETSDVNLKELKNEDFKQLIVQTTGKIKQIKEKHVKKLKAMLEANEINSNDMATLSKNEFVDIIMKGTSIKKGHAAKLYKKLREKCYAAVKSSKYKEYIHALDFETTDDDFFHVLNCHIKYGAQIKSNTFAYFKRIVDCNIDDCDSKERKKTRVERFRTKHTEGVFSDDMNTKKIDPFKLRQRYVQNQLDVMHYFLVHPQERGGSEYQQLYAHSSNRSVIGQSNTFDMLELSRKLKTNDLAPLSEMDLKAKNKTKSYSSELPVPSPKNALDPHGLVADQHKYVTQISKDDAHTAEYGFGVDHSYPHLEPKRNTNIRDELLFNEVCKVKNDDFEDIIMRALKMQRIAIKERRLRCKHYESEYNIIRNESIGIRHMLAIIIYTDLSEFCTAFRATYRAQNKSESEDSVTQRHRHLYFYSRALFEAIAFFGNSMEPNMRVFHGLSEVMMFERFTAYFHQPVSTTSEIDTALRFSRGTGIILEFRRGGSNPSLIPKYLDVSWMSIYPEEDERLFYGNNIVFEISDIIETTGQQKKHRRELRILNMFQRMVKNQSVKWTRTNEKEYLKLQREIADLVWLINDKIKMENKVHSRKHSIVLTAANTLREIAEDINAGMDQDEEDIEIVDDEASSVENDLQKLSDAGIFPHKTENEKEKERSKISEYGVRLFEYFCNNEKTTWICINNYQLIPSQLKHALLYEDDHQKGNKTPQLSFVKLLKLFECLEKVVLNELNVKQMTQQSKNYVKSVLAYIVHTNGYKRSKKAIANDSDGKEDEKLDTNDGDGKIKSELKEIVFESVPEIDSKPNSTLQKLALHYQKSFEKKTFWTIKYEFLLERTHTLTFKIAKHK